MQIQQMMQQRLAQVNRIYSDRVANIQAPNDLFKELLAGKVSSAKTDMGVNIVRATPENLRAMAVAETTYKSAAALNLSGSMAQRKAQVDPLVKAAAAQYDLPENLVHGVIRAESSYNKDAVSSAGAQGLMQLMPATARGLGVSDSFDPAQNIQGGARYLREMLDKFGGDLRLALAAYNVGPGRVNELGIKSSQDATAYTRLSQGARSYVNNVLTYAGITPA